MVGMLTMVEKHVYVMYLEIGHQFVRTVCVAWSTKIYVHDRKHTFFFSDRLYGRIPKTALNGLQKYILGVYAEVPVAPVVYVAGYSRAYVVRVDTRRSMAWVRVPPSAYSYVYIFLLIGTFSRPQIDSRKARERG